MKHKNTQKLTLAAMTAAAYAALSLLGAVFGLTFGPIQVRFSEALCLLPFLFPETAWGLGVGCLIANLFSPYGALDIVVGSLSTLIAALLTARCRSPWTEKYNKTRRIHTEYRALPHGGERISVIGMGSSVIGGGNRQQLRQVLGFLEAPAEQRDYSAINDALAQMDADGTLSRLSVKYFGMDISKEQ